MHRLGQLWAKPDYYTVTTGKWAWGWPISYIQ